MKRFLPLLLLAAFFAVPSQADAGPFRNLRDRIFGSREAAPSCNGPSCQQSVPADPFAAQVAQATPPKAAAQAAPKVVEGIGDGEILQRVVMNRLRARAVDAAMKTGIPTPGGGVRKLTRAEAEKKVKAADDETILDYAKVKGGPVGKLGDGTFLKWLWDNKEAIIKFILSIMALFGDDEPTAFKAAPAVPYTLWTRVEGGAWKASLQCPDIETAVTSIDWRAGGDWAVVRQTLKP